MYIDIESTVQETHKEIIPQTRKQNLLHTHKESKTVVKQNTRKHTTKQTSKQIKQITKHKKHMKQISIQIPTITQTTVEHTQQKTIHEPRTIKKTQVKQQEIVNTRKVETQEEQKTSKRTTVSNKVVKTVPITRSETTQHTFCTGSGISFVFLILTLPLIIYLCLKPIFNLIESICYTKTSQPLNIPPSPIIMHKNPMFGRNIDNDIEMSNIREKKRTPIDKTLHKLPHKKIKKHISSYNESPIHKSHNNIENNIENNPKRKISIINNFKRNSDTEWNFYAAAIYDGDDWQEKIANAIIYVMSCCKHGKH